MPTCEVCGREVRAVNEIALEGAKLLACSRCAKLGEPVRRPTTRPYTSKPRTALHPSSPPSHQIPSYRRKTKPRYSPRELVAVEDFRHLIRKAREHRDMSQQDVARKLNERASVIAKLESGKMTPTIKIARKLERLFNLTLLEEAESIDLSPASHPSNTTLGDVVQVKRKKPAS